MSLRRPAKDQPESFEFNASSLEAANVIVEKYPEKPWEVKTMSSYSEFDISWIKKFPHFKWCWNFRY